MLLLRAQAIRVGPSSARMRLPFNDWADGRSTCSPGGDPAKRARGRSRLLSEWRPGCGFRIREAVGAVRMRCSGDENEPTGRPGDDGGCGGLGRDEVAGWWLESSRAASSGPLWRALRSRKRVSAAATVNFTLVPAYGKDRFAPTSSACFSALIVAAGNHYQDTRGRLMT